MGAGMSTNQVGQNVRSSACGVPLGQPEAIGSPITTHRLQWWDRVAQLVWDESREAPMDLPSSISYAQAGEIVDAAIDQAIAETGGIPGATAFVRQWVGLADDDADAFENDWSALLSGTLPAPTVLLTRAYDGTRSGAYSEPAFLRAYPTISRRGYVMIESIFGVMVPPEPMGTPVFEPPAGMTRREGLEQNLSAAQCTSCHRFFDPLGYSLESFDELGEYRTSDAGKPIDTSGTLQISSSEDAIQFPGIAGLGLALHERCDVNLAFADRFFAYALERSRVPDTTLDGHPEDRARLQQTFIRSSRSYRSLIKGFAQSLAGRDFFIGAK
jgi:hypothetical protein